METTDHKAININSLNGTPFPINIDFSLKDNYYRINLIPISIIEIIELIPLNDFLIFNVDHYEYDELKAISLSRVVSKYASYLKKFDDETLLMKKPEITKLLNEISHYNFCLIDVNEEIDIDKVIQIIDLADKWNDFTVIKEVQQNFFLSSHDDCYLYFETNDKNLALELISLQIKTLVATVSNFPINELKFNPKDLITSDEFSIVIPQNNDKTNEKISWEILNGTFKEFVYEDKIPKSDYNLICFRDYKGIKIEKVQSN